MATIGRPARRFQDGDYPGPDPAHVIERLEHEHHAAVIVHEGDETTAAGAREHDARPRGIDGVEPHPKAVGHIPPGRIDDRHPRAPVVAHLQDRLVGQHPPASTDAVVQDHLREPAVIVQRRHDRPFRERRVQRVAVGRVRHAQRPRDPGLEQLRPGLAARPLRHRSGHGERRSGIEEPGSRLELQIALQNRLGALLQGIARTPHAAAEPQQSGGVREQLAERDVRRGRRSRGKPLDGSSVHVECSPVHLSQDRSSREPFCGRGGEHLRRRAVGADEQTAHGLSVHPYQERRVLYTGAVELCVRHVFHGGVRWQAPHELWATGIVQASGGGERQQNRRGRPEPMDNAAYHARNHAVGHDSRQEDRETAIIGAVVTNRFAEVQKK